MFFLSDVNSIEFAKRKSKVKSYVRKGRIVRQHNREFDSKAALIGGGLGALGIGALATGAYFLGKGRVPKPVIQQVSNADEIANKVISKLPKQQIQQPNVTINTDDIVSRVVSKLPKQEVVDVDDIVSRVSKAAPRHIVKVKVIKPKAVQQTLTKQDVEDVVSNALGKQPKQTVTNIDYDEITKRVTASLPKQQIQTTSSVDNVVDNNLPLLPLKRAKLPIKVYKVSAKKIEEETLRASNMLDDELEIKIKELQTEMQPFVDVEDQIKSSKRLKEIIEKYKKISPYDKQERLQDRWTVEPQNLISKIGLDKVIPKDTPLDKIDFVLEDDLEYLEKLRKQINRLSKIKNIYSEELKKRRELTRNSDWYSEDGLNKAVDRDVRSYTDEKDINRIGGFLDDFSAANDLVEFCNNMNQLNDSYLFFLSDFNYV